MITVRKAEERGHANHGWLNTYHTFSFANYYDPKFTGFRTLLVINEDRVEPGRGFGRHGHEDMEIITYVLEGALEHQDSMGTGSVIQPGDVQRMSAGTGVMHSEFNHSKTEPVHFLQIWILPNQEGLKPSYEEKKFPPTEKRNQLRLIASSTGENGSLKVHQDAKIYASIMDPDSTLQHSLSSNRYGWFQVARGAIELNGQTLEAGDGAAISEERDLTFVAKEPSEFLFFDLP